MRRTDLAIVNSAYQDKVKHQTTAMTAGPHLDGDDGYTLIVPSEWYHKEAATFWKLHGFHWCAGSSTWERDTQVKFNKKFYSPGAWLESTRREYYKFWPTLITRKRCPLCGTRFEPYNEYQIWCLDCSERQQARRKFHDQNQ